jgi:hypothetical protein
LWFSLCPKIASLPQELSAKARFLQWAISRVGEGQKDCTLNLVHRTITPKEDPSPLEFKLCANAMRDPKVPECSFVAFLERKGNDSPHVIIKRKGGEVIEVPHPRFVGPKSRCYPPILELFENRGKSSQFHQFKLVSSISGNVDYAKLQQTLMGSVLLSIEKPTLADAMLAHRLEGAKKFELISRASASEISPRSSVNQS